MAPLKPFNIYLKPFPIQLIVSKIFQLKLLGDSAYISIFCASLFLHAESAQLHASLYEACQFPYLFFSCVVVTISNHSLFLSVVGPDSVYTVQSLSMCFPFTTFYFSDVA